MKTTSANDLSITPKKLAQKAAKMPWKESARVNLFPYENAIMALRERGYSYAEVAEWLSKELGAPVKRGQVYYVCHARDVDDVEKAKEAYNSGELRELPSLDPEEAEKKAAEQDERSNVSTSQRRGKK